MIVQSTLPKDHPAKRQHRLSNYGPQQMVSDLVPRTCTVETNGRSIFKVDRSATLASEEIVAKENKAKQVLVIK